MKIIRITLIFFTLLLVLSGCSKVETYNNTFHGKSENWSGEFIQKGKVVFKDDKELEDYYKIVYDTNETLKLTYIGIEPNLGESVEYSYSRGQGSAKASKGEVIKIKKNLP